MGAQRLAYLFRYRCNSIRNGEFFWKEREILAPEQGIRPPANFLTIRVVALFSIAKSGH
jgi:hypothetical protein